MSRFIDADKLHEEIFEETKFKRDPETNDAVKRLTMPISEVLRRINNQPSADVVEVVRCKDCKYWLPHEQFGFDHRNDEYHDYCDCHMPADDFEAEYWDANDYCSYGRRKEQEE